MITASAAAKVFEPKLFTLDNGMEVALVENHRIPAVVHMVWYRVGAVDEPRGKSGIAHFLEHLMFKGTDTIPPGEFSKIIARHGGEDNAFTSWDYTAYFQKVSADTLPMVMKMESDRMRNLLLNDEAVRTERDVIIEERRQRIDSQPMAILDEQMMNALYQNQPYRIPIIGWLHEMKGLERKDAIDFYRQYYAPSNAILVVAGAVSEQKLRELAEDTYGKLPALPRPERILPQEPPAVAPRDVTYTSEKAELPVLKQAWLVPGFATAKDEKLPYAFKVLEQYLAGSGASVLYQDMVMKKKVATDIGVGYEAERLGEGMLTITSLPVDAKPASFQKAQNAAMAVLQAVARGEIDEKTLQRSKNSMKASAIYARDSLMTPAMVVGEGLVLGHSVDMIETWPEKIMAVTAKDLQAAAALLTPHTMVTGRLYPAPKTADNKTVH